MSSIYILLRFCVSNSVKRIMGRRMVIETLQLFDAPGTGSKSILLNHLSSGINGMFCTRYTRWPRRCHRTKHATKGPAETMLHLIYSQLSASVLSQKSHLIATVGYHFTILCTFAFILPFSIHQLLRDSAIQEPTRPVCYLKDSVLCPIPRRSVGKRY